MNLGKTLVQVATAPVRIGIAIADAGLGIAGETLTAVQRTVTDSDPTATRGHLLRDPHAGTVRFDRNFLWSEGYPRRTIVRTTGSGVA